MSDTFIIITTILGGIGLLLYGIEIMKDSLEWISQGGGQRVLEMAGKSTFKSILAGIAVTVINQKSSATTGMVVGMVNAGMFTLIQAAGVIMGANIGTTVTGQILAFRLELLTPCIVAVGAIIWHYARTKKTENVGKIILGLGIMFVGMIFMEKGFAPLYGYGGVQDFLAVIRHPDLILYLLIALVGFVLTALIRSSSLVHGIIIAMAAQGLLPLEAAVPFILGLNVGKCMATILASRGTSRTARQTALIHLLFNLSGAILVIVAFRHLMPIAMEWLSPDNLPRQIANCHTIFNLGTTILCLPFVRIFARISERLIPPAKGEAKTESNLDVRMLDAPGLALAQAYSEITKMMTMTFESYQLSVQALEHEEAHAKIWDRLQEREDKILLYQKEIEVYLIKLGHRNITKEQRHRMNLMLSAMGDIEQISDISNNIVMLSSYKWENKVIFSDEAHSGLLILHEKICDAAKGLIEAMEQNDADLAYRTLEQETYIKGMEEDLRQAHIERLNQGGCSPGSGVLFMDFVSYMERIAEHIKKTAYFVIELSRN